MKTIILTFSLFVFTIAVNGQQITVKLQPVGKSDKIDSVWVMDFTSKTVYSLKNTKKIIIKKGNKLQYNFSGKGFTDRNRIEIGGDTINLTTNGDVPVFIKAFSGKMKTIVPFYTDKDTVLDVYFDECVDADGNSYTIIKVCDMLWMADNLKTTHYSNGKPIKIVNNNDDWEGDTTGVARFIYDSKRFAKDYGILYNWYAVNKGLAPKGWKVPSLDDWNRMENCDLSGRGKNHNVGDKAKEWALVPAGFCDDDNGVFGGAGSKGYWWLMDEEDKEKAWYAFLHYYESSVGLSNAEKDHGFSVRCFKYIGKK